MVKGKNNYAVWRKNNYYSRKAIFYKSIRTYHYAKLSLACTIEYAGSSMKFSHNNGNTLNLKDALQDCADYKLYANLFLTMQIRGVAMLLTPMPEIEDFQGSSCIMALLSDHDGNTYKDCVESDQSLIMPFHNTANKYFRTSYAWTPTDDTSPIGGKFAINAEAAANTGAFRWSVRFTFYVLYKTNC